MNETANDKYILQSVTHTLRLVDTMAKGREKTVQELAEMTGMGKSSVFRMLATLEAAGYVNKTPDAKYSLSMKLAYIGDCVLQQNDIVHCGHPFLEELMNRSGETAHLTVLTDGIHAEFIDKVVSRSSIRMDSHLGMRRQAHFLSGGKAILAHLPEKAIREYMETADFTPMTEYSIKTQKELSAELAAIRERGYSFDMEESEYGLSCVGAPIYNAAHQVVAAVSVSGPTGRMEKNMDTNILLVMETATLISEAMRK